MQVREQVQREALEKKQARAEADHAKGLEMANLNVECERELMKYAVPVAPVQAEFGPSYKPSSRDIASALQSATKGHFSKVKSNRLVAFIFVRENNSVRGKKCLFKKGTEELAEAGIEGTLIRRAWELRCEVPVMRAPVRENDAAPRARPAASMSRPMLAYSAAQGKKASELLGNAAWVQAVREELDGGVVAWQPAEGTLKIVLSTDPFNVMQVGEKLVEYRVNTPYWRARLLQKDKSFRKFKEVEFSLGYQTNRRTFRARVDNMA